MDRERLSLIAFLDRRPCLKSKSWISLLITLICMALCLPSGAAAASSPETQCFQNPVLVCYQPVVNRGRTLSGIYEPEKFKPFVEIHTPAEFEQIWSENPFYIFAGLAHAAYLTDDEVTTMLQRFGGFGFVFDHNGNQGFLSIWPNRIILTFRGTDETQNMLNNIRVDTVPMEGITVHRGFRQATLELWNNTDLVTRIQEARNQNPESAVYVTGHSLGGGMAVIASLLYRFDRVITFGEPRVGMDIGSVLDSTTRHFRVVNGNDNVTLVPPEIFGYAHHGTEIRIRDTLEISPAISLSGINADHSIVNYGYNLRTLGSALSGYFNP